MNIRNKKVNFQERYLDVIKKQLHSKSIEDDFRLMKLLPKFGSERTSQNTNAYAISHAYNY